MTTESFDLAVNNAMKRLANHPNSVFVGQSVQWDGARIYSTIVHVPKYKRQEHPVIEDHQLGYCIGLALVGKLPICIYPRIDFMLLAANQLVNHLDKLPQMWGVMPKIIIRTTVGRKKPLDAGPQHTNNHTLAFRLMLKTVEVVEVRDAEAVHTAYEKALRANGSTLVVENPYAN